MWCRYKPFLGTADHGLPADSRLSVGMKTCRISSKKTREIPLMKHKQIKSLLFLRTFFPVLFGGLAGMGSLSFAEVITPKVHQFSSENPVPGRDANNTVNGSGLSDDGHHEAAEDKKVWTTLGTYGATDFSPFIIYDLGAVRDITGMHIWNYNSPVQMNSLLQGELSTLVKYVSSIGPDKVEVFTSLDGVSYQSRGFTRFLEASSDDSYRGQLIKVNYKGVRYIKFDFKTSHQGAVYDGTGNEKGDYDARAITGLSEVRFITPSPVEYKFASEQLEVHEGGVGTSYQIRLRKAPVDGQVLRVIAVPCEKALKLNGKEAGIAATVEFTEKNWDQWQSVMVEARDDQVFTTNFVSAIQHYSRSKGTEADPSPGLVALENIPVKLIENDVEIVENLEPIDPAKRMEWFRDLKYYWFIHWNPVSIKGTEISWSRWRHVPVEEYDNLYKQFNPVDFDAEEWVRIAKAAGLKTIVLTTKHHDGFCMWDTKTTDYNIMNSPFKRDVVKELSAACKKHGLRFSLYFSIMDWYNPDWGTLAYGGPGYKLKPSEYGDTDYQACHPFSFSESATGVPPEQKPNMARYIKYMNAQVRELFTKYGDISLIWWDGTDPRVAHHTVWTRERATNLEELARKLQPAMVQNNRVGVWSGLTLPDHWWIDEYGDYDSSEMGLSGFNMKNPWEYTHPLGKQWAYKPNDTYKSTDEVIRDYLVNVVGRDGNFLMNVSPDSKGNFDGEVVQKLTDIGNWLKLHGESIYSTRGGPYKPRKKNKWGVSTRKGNKVYLHILHWPQDKLALPSLGRKIKSSSLLTGGEVKVTQSSSGLEIEVPVHYRKKLDTIVVIELEGGALDIEPISTE